MLQSMGSQRIRQDCATELETPLENRCSILVLSHFNMPTNHLEISLKNKQTKKAAFDPLGLGEDW